MKIRADNIRILFGTHRGKFLTELPDDYLAWIHFDWVSKDNSDYLNKAALQVLTDRGVNPNLALKRGAVRLKIIKRNYELKGQNAV